MKQGRRELMSNLKIIKQINLIRNLNEDNFKDFRPDEKSFYEEDSKLLHEIDRVSDTANCVSSISIEVIKTFI